MNQESPFENYLSGRAGEIDVPGAASAKIADRARSRRRRRRAGSGAVLGVAVLLGGAVLGQGLRSDDSAQEVGSYGAAEGAPELDWTTVDVGNGLGWTRDLVRSDSGTLYALSTSAGDSGSEASYQPVIYGSVDGAEWTPAAMPDDVRVNGLATSGDTIYAVGTGAGGGKVRLASDAGDGWTVTDLPLDLEAESVGLPGRLYVAETNVASADGTTLVAATVTLLVDGEALVAGEDNPTEWYPDRDGMVRWNCAVAGDVVAAGGGTSVSTTSAPAGLTDPEQEAFENAGQDPDGGCGESAREVRTWAELGVDPAVGELINGEVRLFAGATGGPDEVPSFDAVGTIPASYGADVVAGTTGFWAFTPAPYDEASPGDATEARWSPDGSDWSAAPILLEGFRSATGELDGALQVLTVDWSNHSAVLHRLGAGTTSALDLSEVVGLSDSRFFRAAEIGPLGMAMVTSDSSGSFEVLHSADGYTYGRVSTPAPEAGKKYSANGITMSADAVKVRLNVYPAGDTAGGPPEAQKLFVGTPR